MNKQIENKPIFEGQKKPEEVKKSELEVKKKELLLLLQKLDTNKEKEAEAMVKGIELVLLQSRQNQEVKPQNKTEEVQKETRGSLITKAKIKEMFQFDLITAIEGVFIATRIGTFLTLSLMGANTPFLALWIVNTIDALFLTGCAIHRKNLPYTIMNTFWLIIGAIGIYNSVGGNNAPPKH